MYRRAFGAFKKGDTLAAGPKYVTISAKSELDLKNYCKKIYNNGQTDIESNSYLAGLSNIKKTALIKNVTDIPSGISYNITDKLLNQMDTNYTYYIKASLKDDYLSYGDYETINAYNISVKSVAEQTGKKSDVYCKNLPLSFALDKEQYNTSKNYFVATSNTAPPAILLHFGTPIEGRYLSDSVSVTISGNSSDIAVVSLDKPAVVTSDDSNGNNTNINPATGDSAGLLAALGAGMAALGLGALNLKKKKKEEE